MNFKLQNEREKITVKPQDFGVTAETEELVGSGVLGFLFGENMRILVS